MEILKGDEMTKTEKLNEAIEGLVKCDICGCKYWENLVCIDCGRMIENVIMVDAEARKFVNAVLSGNQ